MIVRDTLPPGQYDLPVEPDWVRVQKEYLGIPEMWACWKKDRSDIRVHVGPLEKLMRDNLIHGTDSTNVIQVKRTAGLYMVATIDQPATIDVRILTTRQGYAGSREPSSLLGGVTLSVEKAQQLAQALMEQANTIQEELDAEEPAEYLVTVAIPADRAHHPEHAKNLAAKALAGYQSPNGKIGATVAGEVKVVTRAEKKKGWSIK